MRGVKVDDRDGRGPHTAGVRVAEDRSECSAGDKLCLTRVLLPHAGRPIAPSRLAVLPAHGRCGDSRPFAVGIARNRGERGTRIANRLE